MGDEHQQQLRCAPLIESQKRILVEFLAEHPELQSGNFSQSFTKKRGRELWEQVAGTLNSIPNGARKSWLQWRRTWQDQKKLTKAKITRIRQHSRITGGGGPSEEGLNEYEEEVASLINPLTIAGDQSIRESTPVFFGEPQFVATVTNTAAEVPVIIEECTVEVPWTMQPMESVKENVPASLPVPAKFDKLVAGPSTERTTPPFHVRRASKFKKKSLSDELVQSCRQRTQTISEFQKAKLANLKRKRLRRENHEKQQLELLREMKEIKLQKLALLRESNALRSSQLRELQEINQNLKNFLQVSNIGDFF